MIQIKDLAFSYGSAKVLEHINLKLEPGKVYGLLGENGVGKTTLLTLLCGLKKPKAGEIDIDGLVPFNRQSELLANLCYLPDEVQPVSERAVSWARIKGRFWPEFKLETFSAIMKDFEMDETMKMNAMSYGQLKKTYISFVLACSARYILMDEPTNGLDIPSKTQFRSAVLKYSSEESSIVISTHQVRDLENVIDPIVILDNTGVILNASIEEITSRLHFDYGSSLNPDNLYCEQLPGGFIQVSLNKDGRDSKVNIEALFNAVHKNKELIKDLFSNE